MLSLAAIVTPLLRLRVGTRIETPHVHEAKVNVGPSGKTNLSEKTTRPATKTDIRTARKILERE